MSSAYPIKDLKGGRLDSLRAEEFVALIFFLIFALLICFKIVFFGEVIFTGDNFDLLFPQKQFLVEELEQGRLPLWNPYILSGTPYFADINLGTLSPTNLVYLLLKPVERAASSIMVSELFLIGFFTYLCARLYKISYLSSVISGIVFMSSGIVLAYISNLSILNVVVFLPVIFYFLEKAVSQRSYQLLILCSILFALQIVSGHVQITYYTGFLMALLIFSNKNLSLKAKIKINILFFSLAFALSAVQLFPFMELARLTPRFNQSYDWATQGSLGFIDLVKFIFPKLVWSFTGWVDFSAKVSIGYIGVIPFILMLVGFFAKERKLKILISVILVSIILALGRNTPFYRFFYSLAPGFSSLKVPSQIISLYSFAGALVSGKGLDLIVKKIHFLKISKKASVQFLKILILVFLILFIILLFLLNNISVLDDLFNSYKLAVFAINLFFALLFFIVFLIAVLFFRLEKLFAGLTLILTAVMLDSFLTAQAVLLTSPENEIKSIQTELPDFDKSLYRIYTVPPEQVPQTKVFSSSIERSFAREKRQLLLPNQNIYQKYQAIDGYASMAIKAYIDQFTNSSKTTTGLGRFDTSTIDFSKYAVKFIVSDNIYEVKNPRKRYFLENVGETVLLNENPLELNFLVDSFDTQKFVLLDSYYPGWVAFVDNQEVDIIPFENVYRSVNIGKGLHLLTFRFFPKTIVYGSIVSIVSIMTTVFLSNLLRNKKFHSV